MLRIAGDALIVLFHQVILGPSFFLLLSTGPSIVFFSLCTAASVFVGFFFFFCLVCFLCLVLCVCVINSVFLCFLSSQVFFFSILFFFLVSVDFLFSPLFFLHLTPDTDFFMCVCVFYFFSPDHPLDYYRYRTVTLTLTLTLAFTVVLVVVLSWDILGFFVNSPEVSICTICTCKNICTLTIVEGTR